MIRLLVFFLFAVNIYADVNITLTKLLTNTIHDLQIERADACDYVFEKSEKNLNKYKISIKNTDKTLKILKSYIEKKDLNIKSDLTNLRLIRKKLLNSNAKCKDVFSYYTMTVSQFLDLLSRISEYSNYKNLLYQYSILMMYEESIWEKKLEIKAFLKLKDIKKISNFYLSSSTKEKIFYDVIDKTLMRKLFKEWHSYNNSSYFNKLSELEARILKKIKNEKENIDIATYEKLITLKIKNIQQLERDFLYIIIKKSRKESLFNDKEKEFIIQHKQIRYVFDPNWKPFEFKDEIGEHRGIIADIIKIIKAKTNLNLIPVATDSWSEAKKLVKEKKADMFSAITENKKRKKYLNFTKHTIFSYDAVLIGRKNCKKPIETSKIGIKRGYVLTDYIKQHYPKAEIFYFNSLKDGLNALRNGKIDYFVNNIIIAKYYINKLGYNDLKVAKKLNYKFKLKIALRKDEPKIILNIIDKALGTITKDELNKIYDKWINYNDKTLQISDKTYSLLDVLPLRQMLIIGVFLILVLLIMLNYFKKKKNIALGVSVFAFVGVFLFFIILITVISVKNLEKIKKSELSYSLNTILNTTHEALRKILLSQEDYLNMILQNDSIQTLEKIKYLDFVNGYIVIDPSYHVLNSSFDISVIDNKNFIQGIKKAKEYGYSLIFPVKQSIKPLQNIFFIKTVYKDFVPVRYIAVAINKNILQSVLEKGRMGQSGETYLVNTHKQMVSQSRFDNELRKLGLLKKGQSSFLNIKVDTLASRSALKHINGINTSGYKDYRGIKVFGAWEWDNDYNIAIVTEIDEKEAMQSFLNTKTTIYYALFSVVSFVIILMVFIVWFTNKSKKELEEKNIELESFNVKLETLVKERTKSLEEAKKEIEIIHKHTQESIEFASMLQDALIPHEEELKKCFEDSFVIWKPKDIVGGDIWLFEKIRDGECILMLIDCTGHGVPGAFVTMIVKAIEREIISKYKESDLDVSPSYILSYFNKTIKKLLKQEDITSTSNAGFDGGVLYINKKKNIIKYSSAKTPLFIVKDEIEVIKGDRYSVGYKKNDADFVYKEFTFNIEKNMLLYFTTDGFLDQLGGEKCFPFGKKRFKQLIMEVKDLPFSEQKKLFIKTLEEFMKKCQNNEQNDDITLVGMKL